MSRHDSALPDIVSQLHDHVAATVARVIPGAGFELTFADAYDGDFEYVLTIGHAEATVRISPLGDMELLVAGVDWVPLDDVAVMAVLYRDSIGALESL